MTSDSSDSNASRPLRRQLFRQLNWLAQLWATGAEPSPQAQTALDKMESVQRWTSHRWLLNHPVLDSHPDLVVALDQQLEQKQFLALIELLDAAAQIMGNGSAEELAIALRFLAKPEQQMLLKELTHQWQTDRRWQWMLSLGRSRPDRTSRFSGNLRSHLSALLDTAHSPIQALSLFLLHQLSTTEGLAQATHLLSRRVKLAPELEQVAKAILATPVGESVAIARCPLLTDLPLPADVIQFPPDRHTNNNHSPPYPPGSGQERI